MSYLEHNLRKKYLSAQSKTEAEVSPEHRDRNIRKIKRSKQVDAVFYALEMERDEMPAKHFEKFECK